MVDDLDHILVDAGRVEGAIDADPDTADAARQGSEIVGHRILPGRRIVGVGARDHAQDGSSVGGAAGHRADMVQRFGEAETPWRLTRPQVGLRPVTPFTAGGSGSSRRYRSRANRSTGPAAVATPDPVDEAPGPVVLVPGIDRAGD